jgi:phosphoglycerate dehydrogenase-like enzyme
MKIVAALFNRAFAAWVMPDWCIDHVRRALPGVEFVPVDGRERLLAEVGDAVAVFTARMTPEVLSAAPKLEWVHSPMAGLDYLLIPQIVSGNIVVTNSRGVHAEPMAEHAMGMMLLFARRFHDCLAAQREGLWQRDAIYDNVPSFDELAGKNLGIIGFGAIGRAVARRARAFGMHVIAFRRSGTPDDLADRMYRVDELDAVLPELDYVVVVVPGLPETEGLLDRSRIDRMKATAVLINLARGSVLDQDALIDALNAGRVAGAGLDVFTPEPLPDHHPLFHVRNLVLTPHVSGTSPMLWHRTIDLFIENVGRYQRNEPLLNVVDKQRGY